MSTSRSKQLDRLAMGLFSDSSELLDVARRVSDATGAPIVGGIAVFLHGYQRTTVDVDVFAADPDAVRASLLALGATWDRQRREFLLDRVPVHLITENETGGLPEATETKRGITVVSLPDLVKFKLRSGLQSTNRAKDLADVVELIRNVPLDKRFATRLPKNQRAPFKKLVDAVRDESGRR